MDPFFNGNNDENNQDEEEKKAFYSLLPSNYAIVTNGENTKVNKVGFSYTSLFFGVLPAILRSDWYNLACMIGIQLFFSMLVTFVTGIGLDQASESLSFLFQVIWGFIYNLMYFRHLQNIGYNAGTPESLKLLVENHYFKVKRK